MENREVADTILKQAIKVVTQDRGNQHGDAENSFQMIADLWSSYLTHSNRSNLAGPQLVSVSAFDVAQMMVLLKVARSVYGDPTSMDHYVDEAGYASLAAMIAAANKMRTTKHAPAPAKMREERPEDKPLEASFLASGKPRQG